MSRAIAAEVALITRFGIHSDLPAIFADKFYLNGCHVLQSILFGIKYMGNRSETVNCVESGM